MVHPGDLRESASRATLASLRWWGPSLAICALCLVAGIGQLVTNARVAESVPLFAIVAITGSFAVQARKEFRRGWRYGYESAIRTALEYQAGKVPDVEARAAVRGDPVPEPWERHVSPLVTRSSR